MPKRGQHKDDAINPSKPKGHEKSRGHNKPGESQTITTGTYKKQETYEQQAYNHEDPGKLPQTAYNPWNADTRDKPTIEGSVRARESSVSTSGRSGSESNRSRKTRGH